MCNQGSTRSVAEHQAASASKIRLLLPITMNTFVNRFSSTSAANELHNGESIADDGEFSDAMWGSEAGFGSLAKGVPNFTVPAVPDVSSNIYEIGLIHGIDAIVI